MKSFPFGQSLLLLLFAMICTPSSAQNPLTRSDTKDYFPNEYFFKEKDNPFLFSSYSESISEVVYYMRLAGITPLCELRPAHDQEIVRLQYAPKYSHPLFISVVKDETEALLYWKKGNAMRGHSKPWICDTVTRDGRTVAISNYYDPTIREYGTLDSGTIRLFPEMWEKISRMLAEMDFLHHRSMNPSHGSDVRLILEYGNEKRSKSFFSMCPHLGDECQVVEYLVSLVDSEYVHMNLWTPTHNNDKWEYASFPGGREALVQFLEDNVRYPQAALDNLIEGSALVWFVIEKDGSVNAVHIPGTGKGDVYGLEAELMRVAKMMPNWNPATKDGQRIRSNEALGYEYVLPDSIRPKYGSPNLKNRKDSLQWENIEKKYRALLMDSSDYKNAFGLGMEYYNMFLDTNCSKMVSNPADSALKYFYWSWRSQQDTASMLDMYLPCLYLEKYLHVKHHELVKIPVDTAAGLYYPILYFVGYTENGFPKCSNGWDSYFSKGSTSYYFVQQYSSMLEKMKEPVLYNLSLPADEEVFRYSFYPSFAGPVVFRIVKDAKKTTLYWRVLKINSHKLANANFTVAQCLDSHAPVQFRCGHLRMSSKKYEHFMELEKEIKLESLPNNKMFARMDVDGYLIERQTANGYKACLRTFPSKEVKEMYSYLQKISKKARYMKKYL